MPAPSPRIAQTRLPAHTATARNCGLVYCYASTKPADGYSKRTVRGRPCTGHVQRHAPSSRRPENQPEHPRKQEERDSTEGCARERIMPGYSPKLRFQLGLPVSARWDILSRRMLASSHHTQPKLFLRRGSVRIQTLVAHYFGTFARMVRANIW